MSIVGDLRETPQDVVTPDLKAVVRGLADLKEEMHSSNALLREEMQSGNALLRREIEQARQESRENTAVLREETCQHIALLRDEAKASEARSIERMQHLQDAFKLALMTQRTVEL